MTRTKAETKRGEIAPTLRAMVEHVSSGSAPDSWKIAARELRALLAVARAAKALAKEWNEGRATTPDVERVVLAWNRLAGSGRRGT